MKVIINYLPDIIKNTDFMRDLIECGEEETNIDERFIFNDGVIIDGKVKLRNLNDLDNFIVISNFFGCIVPNEVYNFVYNCEFRCRHSFDSNYGKIIEARNKFFGKYSESNITAKSFLILLNITRKKYMSGSLIYDKNDIDKIIEHIAKFNLISLFEYICSIFEHIINNSFYCTMFKITHAIQYNNIDLLTRMLKNGWKINHWDYRVLAKSEKIDILTYLINNNLLNKNKLKDIILGVYSDKDIDIVRLCINRGAKLNSQMMLRFTYKETFKILKLLHDKHSVEFHKDCCLKCFKHNRDYDGWFDLFKYIVNHSVEIEVSIFFRTIEQDLFDWFKYIVDSKIPSGSKGEAICNCAAYYGRIKYLKYLRKKNVPWNSKVIAMSMIQLHYDCMIYAIKNGCKWSNDIRNLMLEDNLITDTYLRWGRYYKNF